ncbi:VOC family protein [uncultured Aquitalea sp.]|uniref:VOC family protein n=1 Tax=uncultured Aquitalea sp. TaxID=540272 RepID=UPI0025E0E4A0|nr:VOC family protein [uncultured Aquitalea sp.]
MAFVHWFEIPAADFDRAVRFYEQVFGIALRREDFMDDRIAVFPDSSGCVMQTGHLPPGQTGTRLYLDGGEQLEQLLSRVEAAGGVVALPLTRLPDGNGDIARIIDSEGNLVGLHREP